MGNSMIYVTSDQHFGHNNILKYEPLRVSQGATSLYVMQEILINNWNKIVKPTDIVYELGDFYMGKSLEELDNIISQLHGTIKFVKGNHDSHRNVNYLTKLGYEVQDLGYEIKYNHIHYFMSHYGMDVGGHSIDPNANHEGIRYNLHGHIHNSLYDDPKKINICVDSPLDIVRNVPLGSPISLETIDSFIRREVN